MADGGYDITDYDAIDDRFGSLADADALIGAARDRAGDRSRCERARHPMSTRRFWFRDDPERYVWSDRDGPANNWVGVFGGVGVVARSTQRPMVLAHMFPRAA